MRRCSSRPSCWKARATACVALPQRETPSRCASTRRPRRRLSRRSNGATARHRRAVARRKPAHAARLSRKRGPDAARGGRRGGLLSHHDQHVRLYAQRHTLGGHRAQMGRPLHQRAALPRRGERGVLRARHGAQPPACGELHDRGAERGHGIAYAASCRSGVDRARHETRSRPDQTFTKCSGKARKTDYNKNIPKITDKRRDLPWRATSLW